MLQRDRPSEPRGRARRLRLRVGILPLGRPGRRQTSRGATSRTTSSAWIGWSGLRVGRLRAQHLLPQHRQRARLRRDPRPPAGWSPPRAPDRTPPDGQALPQRDRHSRCRTRRGGGGRRFRLGVNTYVGMKTPPGIRAPVLPGRGTGGLSGPVIKTLALAAVPRCAGGAHPGGRVGGIMMPATPWNSSSPVRMRSRWAPRPS